MFNFTVQQDKKKYPKHKNKKMFAGLQISFLAQEQKACSHILLQHTAYLGTVGKGEKENIKEIWWERNKIKEKFNGAKPGIRTLIF